MATIKDVAKEAGVSIATVSRVLNQSPKASAASVDAVRKAMSKLGYRPNANARALVSQNTQTMGILVADVSDPFFGTLVKAVDNVTKPAGKHLLVCNGYHVHSEEKAALELLINSRCESLVIHSKALSDDELIRYAGEVKGLVIINRYIPALASRCISLDNRKGTYLATELLIRHGHSKIAHIASNHPIEDVTERIDGFRAAMTDNGLDVPDNLIEYGEPNSEGGELATRNLLAKSVGFTAIVAYNDYMAAGAITVFEENGFKIPQNISVTGFDDSFIAKYMYPKLTTISYPIQLMAEQAARLSLALAEGEAPKDISHRFTPTIIRRDSVQKI
ncbi:HTH-type transcriptional regulator GalR [Vibrio aerogenes CECT 7868]|uniref:HTH-type transcriptional regulator GalR n=1 Tax=Vibrio aerogenes CECT 7868 TaxID=1216006 RepID=A0A1M5ZLJ7_9VIBR|nr:substrate-binding domain-containing protein [Vibrio aerogenes]SHI25064.1 HTH-type transcriptional regulator GalR [Vibrio aerogenes CECT 7868]